MALTPPIAVAFSFVTAAYPQIRYRNPYAFG
jgi:hypothetical protein